MSRIAALLRAARQRNPKQLMLAVSNRCHNYFYGLGARGLDFGGYIPKEELSDGESAEHAEPYQGFSAYYLKLLIKEAVAAGGEFEQFIDVGSGKGKTCLYAARFHAFRRVIGLEFSERLVGIARANLARVGKKGLGGIEFVQGDAGAWRIPDGRSVVFLFNPFDGVILERFLTGNLGHFEKFGSVLVYANAVHREVVERCGLRRMRDSGVFNCYLFHF